MKLRASRQNTQNKNLKNFSKCFSWLEVLPARESQGKSRKSLSPLTTGLPPVNKSPNWVARNTWKIFKVFFVIGALTHQWVAKNLCVDSRLGYATRPTRDWVAKTRQHYFLKFWHFLQKQKTFQKQLKHSKIFLCLINKDWACENTFNQVQSHKWIWHSLNIDICVVCEYQKWDSP